MVRASEGCTQLGHGLDTRQMFSFFPCCHAKHNRTLSKKTSWFANGNKTSLEKSFWTEHVSLYLDATSFPHKTNLFEPACAPKVRRRTTKSAGIDIMHFKGMKREDRKNLLSEHTCRNCNCQWKKSYQIIFVAFARMYVEMQLIKESMARRKLLQ